MKLFGTLLTFLALNSAHASYYATHCSNSKADVKWKIDRNISTMTIKYVDQDEKEIEIPIYNLDVKFITEVPIHSESVRVCGFASSTRVYAGKVEITPAADYPNALDFLGENKKIETQVICTIHMNGRTPCPEIDAK